MKSINRLGLCGLGTLRLKADRPRFIRNGLSNKEIAVAFHIGIQTVKNHIRTLSIKIGLHRLRANSGKRSLF
ncbi:MAG: response regulator transcription factor [Nitrospira defluvii]|nr:response regulator transcription factor [Nitrospira defluvii]